MKKAASIVILSLLFFSTYAQDRGIGLRLGNPMGITYKKYLPKNKAVELGIGTGYTSWYHNYYENSFHDFDKYEGFDYVSHTVRTPLYLQARYQLHNDIYIEGLIGKLEWYWGIGALMKIANVDYRYRDNGLLITDRRTDFDFGPEGMLGMEYTFEDIPLTIFGEFSLVIEFADRPGALRGYSGVGARYNF